MVNLMPGYSSCKACAITCEVECQKAVLPSSLFHVYKTKLPSVVKGVTVSTVVPLKLAEITLRAKPSLMLKATSCGVMPEAYSRTEPSGNVILIIFKLNLSGKYTKEICCFNKKIYSVSL